MLAAFGVGYIVWGSRIEDLSNEVGFLADVVTQQSRLIRDLARQPAPEPAPVTAKTVENEPPPVPDCPPAADEAAVKEAAARLQSQLEACLFEKASLQRSLQQSRKQVQLMPRAGTSPVQEERVLPGGLPGMRERKAAGDDASKTPRAITLPNDPAPPAAPGAPTPAP